MYRIGICDDDMATCIRLEDYIENFGGDNNLRLDIEIWNCGKKLCDYLKNGETLDILLLDIELSDMGGIDVAKYIRNKMNNKTIQIVFISACKEYALELFQIQPLNFLVKPIQKQALYEVLRAGIDLLGIGNQCFEFQTNCEFFRIPYKDIVYLCSSGRKIKIVTIKLEYEFYGKLQEVKELLPNNFVQIHKSYLINYNQIYRCSYEFVEMNNLEKINISKPNRKKVREYMIQKMKDNDQMIKVNQQIVSYE